MWCRGGGGGGVGTRPLKPEIGGGGVLALNSLRLRLKSSPSRWAFSTTSANGLTSAAGPEALETAAAAGSADEVPAGADGSSAGGGDGCGDETPTGSLRGASPLPRVRAREGDAALRALGTKTPEVTVELRAG